MQNNVKKSVFIFPFGEHSRSTNSVRDVALDRKEKYHYFQGAKNHK
jgi:hypothetical protein